MSSPTLVPTPTCTEVAQWVADDLPAEDEQRLSELAAHTAGRPLSLLEAVDSLPDERFAALWQNCQGWPPSSRQKVRGVAEVALRLVTGRRPWLRERHAAMLLAAMLVVASIYGGALVLPVFVAACVWARLWMSLGYDGDTRLELLGVCLLHQMAPRDLVAALRALPSIRARGLAENIEGDHRLRFAYAAAERMCLPQTLRGMQRGSQASYRRLPPDFDATPPARLIPSARAIEGNPERLIAELDRLELSYGPYDLVHGFYPPECWMAPSVDGARAQLALSELAARSRVLRRRRSLWSMMCTAIVALVVGIDAGMGAALWFFIAATGALWFAAQIWESGLSSACLRRALLDACITHELQPTGLARWLRDHPEHSGELQVYGEQMAQDVVLDVAYFTAKGRGKYLPSGSDGDESE